MSAVRLTEEDIAFFHVTFDIFPSLESPLRYIASDGLEPSNIAQTFDDLSNRGLLAQDGSGASESLRSQLTPVAECDARVILRDGTQSDEDIRRSFYVCDGHAVEYQRRNDTHMFGPAMSESALVDLLTKAFVPSETPKLQSLKFSPGDYLVFAVFARDLRKGKPPADDDSPMSIDEVLAYFEEPEPNEAAMPQDESWRASLETLAKAGVVEITDDGYALHQSLHDFAREVIADHQRSIVRFDYLDENWLVRELNLYPGANRLYRLGTCADGSVMIDELSSHSLKTALASVVSTLPNLFGEEVAAAGPDPQA